MKTKQDLITMFENYKGKYSKEINCAINKLANDYVLYNFATNTQFAINLLKELKDKQFNEVYYIVDVIVNNI